MIDRARKRKYETAALPLDEGSGGATDAESSHALEVEDLLRRLSRDQREVVVLHHEASPGRGVGQTTGSTNAGNVAHGNQSTSSANTGKGVDTGTTNNAATTHPSTTNSSTTHPAETTLSGLSSLHYSASAWPMSNKLPLRWA